MVPPKDGDTVEQATEYKLQLATDIFHGLGYIIVYSACALLCAGVAVFWFLSVPPDVVGWVVMLAIAGGCLAYGVHLLRKHLPLNSSVHVSDIGIVSRGWFQADRFIPASDIIGVVWTPKRAWTMLEAHWPRWFYSLFLEVPELAYGRSRIKLGSSRWAGPIGEARDRIIKEYGLQEVDELRVEPVFFWHSTKRQVWRRTCPPKPEGKG